MNRLAYELEGRFKDLIQFIGVFKPFLCLSFLVYVIYVIFGS